MLIESYRHTGRLSHSHSAGCALFSLVFRPIMLSFFFLEMGHYLSISLALKAHYATIVAKITLIMQVESRSDHSRTISGSFDGCFIAPSRFSKEKANMQLALFGTTQSGCDSAEVAYRDSKM